MKFINRNAYIMTAVYGKNFCWSAKEAFTLLMRNIVRYFPLNTNLFTIAYNYLVSLYKSKIIFCRVFVLDNVTDFLLLLGKLVIVGSVGVLSFYTFSGKYIILIGLYETPC